MLGVLESMIVVSVGRNYPENIKILTEKKGNKHRGRIMLVDQEELKLIAETEFKYSSKNMCRRKMDLFCKLAKKQYKKTFDSQDKKQSTLA